MIFCEPSLEDPLGECFDQFGGALDLDKLLENVETFNEPSLEDLLGEIFYQIGCDLDLDKFLKQAKMFCEPSLEDPLEERFSQFEFDLDLEMICEQAEALLDSTPENNKVEEEEEQTEVLGEPHREKEESTETSSTSAPIPEVPRVQKRSRLGLCDEQIEDIKIEKLPEYSSYFIPVQDFLPDEKLFEKTQNGLPQHIDIWNHTAIGRIHSL